MDSENRLKGKLIEHFRTQIPETEEQWKSKILIQRDSGDEFEVVGVDIKTDRINLQKVGVPVKITKSISDLKQILSSENGAWSFKL